MPTYGQSSVLGASIETAEIADNAVTTVKIANSNVTMAKILGTDLTIGSGNINLYPHTYTGVEAGTWAWVDFSGTAWGNFGFYNSTAADADGLNWKIYLAAGTYKLHVFYCKSTDVAIVDFYVDAAQVDTLDMYAGAATYNNRHVTSSAFTMATSGLVTFKMVADGKNASSSAYKIKVAQISIVRQT